MNQCFPDSLFNSSAWIKFSVLQLSYLTQIILDSHTQMFNEKRDLKKKTTWTPLWNPTTVSLMKTGDLGLTFSSRRAAAQFCIALYQKPDRWESLPPVVEVPTGSSLLCSAWDGLLIRLQLIAATVQLCWCPFSSTPLPHQDRMNNTAHAVEAEPQCFYTLLEPQRNAWRIKTNRQEHSVSRQIDR